MSPITSSGLKKMLAYQVLLALHHNMNCDVVVAGNSLAVEEGGQKLRGDDNLAAKKDLSTSCTNT